MSGIGDDKAGGMRWSLGANHYQFYCTSPAAQYEELDLAGADTVYQYYGSAVAVKIPGKTADVGALKPIPTGSSREVGENFPSELGSIEFMDTEAFRVNGMRQVQGITEHQQYVATVSESGRVTVSGSLHAAWVAPDGHTPWAGAYMPIGQSLSRDILYDLAPSWHKKGTKKIDMTVPDADWYQRACLQRVTSEEFGTRTFVIMESADGAFHCWPLSSPKEEGIANPVYEPQKIKTNVPGKYAKKVLPNYPAWVYVGDSKRDTFNARSSRETLDPRYVWYFNREGTKAIAAMVERKTIELNYSKVTVGSATPAELPTDVSIKIRAEGQFYSGDTTTDPVQQDRLGRVELSLNVSLTGENLEDFTFSVGVLSHVAPTDVDEGRLISSAYAMPTDWSRFTGNIGNIQPDDIIESRIFLYEHQDRINYVKAIDGNYGSEQMHQSIIVVRNETRNEELLRFAVKLLMFEDAVVPLMNAGTYLSYILNRSYLGKLAYFDLSSLSFHYTVTGQEFKIDDTVVASTTDYDRYLVMRRARLRHIVYAFGQPVHTVDKGDQTFDLDTFIAATTPVDDVFLFPVNTISTIRGAFGVEQDFWWTRGGTYSAYQNQFFFHWHYEEFGTVPGYGPALSAITEESFYADFMMKVYNEIADKLNDMNINFDLEMWGTDIRWLLWQIFVRARDSLNNGVDWDESRVKTVFTIAIQQFTPGATQTFASLYKPPLNIFNEDVIVRGFPQGELAYADTKSTMMPWHSVQGKVLVHPDGHCSSYHKRLLAVGKSWFPIYNVQKYRRANLLSKNSIALDLVTYGQAQNLNPYDTFDQVLVDYVHFWDGAIQTSHNDLYNGAYEHDFDLSLYNQVLQMGFTPNNQVGLLQDGLYIPLHFVNSTSGVLATNYPAAYYSTPPAVSSTRLSAAFV